MRAAGLLKKVFVVCLLTQAPSFSASSFAAEVSSGWQISESRLILNEGRSSETLWLTNETGRPWWVTGAVFETDANGKATDTASSVVLMTPPASVVGQKQKYPVKIVWVGTEKDWSSETEILQRLRLTMLPAKNAQHPEELQISVALWVKLFLRSEHLKKKSAFDNSVRIHCSEGSVKVKNLSPYWMTLRSLRISGSELISPKGSAPMIAPYGEIELETETSDCTGQAEAFAIDDDGFLKKVPVRRLEGK